MVVMARKFVAAACERAIQVTPIWCRQKCEAGLPNVPNCMARSCRPSQGKVISRIECKPCAGAVVACYTAGMMEDADILRSANQLIKSYGEKAAEVAAGKVVAKQQAGDDEGMTDWVNIMLAIRDLQR